MFNKGGVEFWTLYLVLALGDIPAVDLGQRVAAAKSPRVAQKSMIIAVLAIIFTLAAFALTRSPIKTIYPNSKNPETLMLAFAQGYFPPVLSAIFLTAMAAMGMSTVAACYVATSGIVTKNIYLDFINKNPDSKKLLLFSRIMILLSAVLGFILAVSAQKVIDLAYLAWDIIFVTIFWPIVLGPFWKRVSTPAVWASITAGLAYYIITSLTHVPGPKVESDGFIGLLSELWLVPGFSGVVISGITIVVVSLIIPPSQHVLDMHKIERDESLDEVGSKDEIEELKKATN